MLLSQDRFMSRTPKSSRKGSGRKRRPPRRIIPVPKILCDFPDQSLPLDQETELKAMLALVNDDEKPIENRIETICPKGSILDVVADIFRRTTDIPLELPICMVMSYISARLMDGGAGLRVCGKYVDPFLWMILLSESGNGKTYTEQFISCHITVPMFPQINSAAVYVEKLTHHNRSLWIQDEFAQLLKRIQTKDYMSDLREYLLRTYDKSELVRSNMKGTTFVPDPVLSILGMTVSSTFAENISSEMMLDGFMQRFQVVYAENDPKRPLGNYPYYRTHERRWSTEFARAWSKIATIDVSGEYHLGRGAREEYETRFRQLAERIAGALPGSFFRRILWNANKLALVYHIILGKPSKIIDREDMKWAMNMTAIHLQDLRRLVDSYGVSELSGLVERGEKIRDRFKARRGRPITRREFTTYLKGVDNHGLMSFIMSVLDIK
jgi:hypothetical protein